MSAELLIDTEKKTIACTRCGRSMGFPPAPPGHDEKQFILGFIEGFADRHQTCLEDLNGLPPTG